LISLSGAAAFLRGPASLANVVPMTAVTVTDRSALASALRDPKLSGMLDTLDARLAQAHAGKLGHLDFLQACARTRSPGASWLAAGESVIFYGPGSRQEPHRHRDHPSRNLPAGHPLRLAHRNRSDGKEVGTNPTGRPRNPTHQARQPGSQARHATKTPMSRTAEATTPATRKIEVNQAPSSL
jgi:hypothetical protein